MSDNTNFLKNLSVMARQGNTVLLSGGTGEGKSALLASIAHKEVKSVLGKRVGDGKTTRILTRIVYTDNKALDPNKIFIDGLLKNPKASTIDSSSGVALFFELVYAMATLLDKTKGKCNESELRAKVIAAFMAQKNIKKNDNTSPVTQLYQAFPDFDRNKLDELINELFDILKGKGDSDYSDSDYMRTLADVLSEVDAELGKNDKKNKRKKSFQNKLAQSRKEWANSFYEKISKIFSDKMDDIKKLIGCNGEIYDKDRFRVALPAEQNSGSDRDLFSLLFETSGENIEFLVSDIRIMVRINEKFEDDLRDIKFKVAIDEDNREVHQITIVDTQGLMHNKDDDSDRLISDSAASAPSIILLLKSFDVNSGSKNVDEIVKDFLLSADKHIEIVPLFSKHDLFVNSLWLSSNSDDYDDFGDSDGEISIEDIEKKTRDMIDKIKKETGIMVRKTIDEYEDILRQNTNPYNRKPFIGEDIVYGKVMSNYPIEVKKMLAEEGYTFVGAIHKILKATKESLRSAVCTISNTDLDNLKREIMITIPNNKFPDVKSILSDMLKCKGEVDPTHHFTMYACISHWCAGRAHQSDAKVYDNIKTEFVNHIKTYAHDMFRHIKFTPEGEAVMADRKDDLLKLFNNGDIFSPSYSVIFARNIGKEALKDVEAKNANTWMEVHEKFIGMIDSAKDKYFINNDPKRVAALETALKKAYQEYIEILINKHCIITWGKSE